MEGPRRGPPSQRSYIYCDAYYNVVNLRAIDICVCLTRVTGDRATAHGGTPNASGQGGSGLVHGVEGEAEDPDRSGDLRPMHEVRGRRDAC